MVGATGGSTSFSAALWWCQLLAMPRSSGRRCPCRESTAWGAAGRWASRDCMQLVTFFLCWSVQSTENAVDSVVKAATKVGNKGGSIAVKAMKSIRDHPCESSPAPGCVTP